MFCAVRVSRNPCLRVHQQGRSGPGGGTDIPAWAFGRRGPGALGPEGPTGPEGPHEARKGPRVHQKGGKAEGPQSLSVNHTDPGAFRALQGDRQDRHTGLHTAHITHDN